MENLTSKILLAFTLLLFMASGCKKDNMKDLDNSTFRAVVDNGGGFPDPIEDIQTSVSNTYMEEIEGETWTCTTETQSIQQGGGGKDGFPLFSPNSSVIYPGNMLQGNSLNSATPKIIAVERAGGNISTDVVDGNIQSSFEVDRISKSEVTDAINNIIDGSTGVVPSNFNFVYNNVQSREQFALEVGVDVNTAFTELESKLNFSTDNSYNRYYVSLNQSFYTMSFDIPTSLDQLFDPSVTPEDLARYVGPGNPATYISDVTYGRIYYMLIESTSSVTDMDLAISASFNGFGANVEGDLETNYLASLSELKVQVFAYGGAASSTLQTIGETNLNQLANLLAESSDIRSGKPISYVVRSVYDNQIVSTQLATQYDVTNCTPNGADGAPPYTEHWAGNVVSAMGPVGAAYNTYGNEFILINKEGDRFMRSNTGTLEGPFHIDELGTESCPLDGIGAAVNFKGNQNNQFYLMAFDKSGTQFNYMNANGVWLDNEPISNLANGNSPFNITGVGAITFTSVDPNGPSGRYMFNKEGNKYSHFNSGSNSFGAVHNLWEWGPDNTCPFNEVGAGIGFYIGNDRFFILFDESGLKYTVYGNVAGSGNETFIGPFNL